MSSHREAPEISKDPVADNTDVYAFVSPDQPDTVTILANFIPLQGADGGPNFYEFGDDVLYEIHIVNHPDNESGVTYQFRFHTKITNPDTFLYNTGPISAIDDHVHWTRPQFYSVSRVVKDHGTERHRVLRTGLACPPVNVGVRSTPNYAHTFTHAAVHGLGGHGRRVFAGQRAEGFHVDLGSIFDLGALRPFQNLHLIPSAAAVGRNGGRSLNVHTIALQLPISDLTVDGTVPTHVHHRNAVIGVYASASRRHSTVRSAHGAVNAGSWVQVSRLGNPLFNEVIVPMSEKDKWNALPPSADAAFAKYVQHPELAKLLPVLYPGVFPNLATYHKVRIDLAATLLTGIPNGVIPGFQNFTGSNPADLLRLNVAIPPSGSPSPYGILGGDLAGFPNGRRITDDIIAIELRAVAGATIPLVDPSYTADGAASVLVDGTGDDNRVFLDHFPYLGNPNSGSEVMPGTPG